MSDEKPLYILPDANIFLEYPRLDSGDWCSALDGQQLVFEIPVHTVKELDAKRDASRARLRKRAQKTTTWLLKVQESGEALANGAKLSFLVDSPVAFLERGDLDRHNPDDVLVACALRYREQHPERELLVLSEDAGVVLKARGYGLHSEQPPRELRLPAELSDEEREAQKLRERVEQLELGRPELVLRCEENPSVVSVNPVVASVEEFVDGRIIEEQEKRTPARQLSDAQQEELESYLQKYREYLAKLFPKMRTSLRSFALELTLENIGRGAAHDIDVSVYAPSGVSLATELPEYPKAPEAPDFRDAMQRMLSTPSFGMPDLSSLHLGPGLVHQLQAPVGDWRITGDGEADISVRKLKHGRLYHLEGLIASFDEDAVNFSLEWSANVENSPEPFEGTVNFVSDENRDGDGYMAFLSATEDS